MGFRFHALGNQDPEDSPGPARLEKTGNFEWPVLDADPRRTYTRACSLQYEIPGLQEPGRESVRAAVIEQPPHIFLAR